jgi:putative peptide zinc metalloprotease protein
MTATAPPPASPVEGVKQTPLNRAEGVQLLGPVHGCGYRDGVALVRRADGQMVQLGPLMYGLLEAADGTRDARDLADALTQKLGRRLEVEHVARLAEKLAVQGLLAGTEHRAPPRSNPLLALRWKVLVTNPRLTKRLTQPFMFLLVRLLLL